MTYIRWVACYIAAFVLLSCAVTLAARGDTTYASIVALVGSALTVSLGFLPANIGR